MARNDPQVNFRMPAELKDKLEVAAKEAGRSTTGEIVARLERTFDAPNADLVLRTIAGLEYELAKARYRYSTLQADAERLAAAVAVSNIGSEQLGARETTREEWLQLVNQVMHRVSSGASSGDLADERQAWEALQKARRAYFKAIGEDFE